jgi:hypothetical protein
MTSGSITECSIPIGKCTYYPYPDLDVHYNIPHVEKLILVDLHDFTVVERKNTVPAGLTAVYSISCHKMLLKGLCPQN